MGFVCLGLRAARFGFFFPSGKISILSKLLIFNPFCQILGFIDPVMRSFKILIISLVLVFCITYQSTFATVKTKVHIINERGTNTFVCEIAKSPKEWQEGLMYRRTMNTNEGMLFIFPYASYIPFWMKNTYLTLAIIFIDEDNNVVDVFYPKPLSTNSVYPSRPSRYVLEILSNVSVNFNIKRGDRVIF